MDAFLNTHAHTCTKQYVNPLIFAKRRFLSFKSFFVCYFHFFFFFFFFFWKSFRFDYVVCFIVSFSFTFISTHENQQTRKKIYVTHCKSPIISDALRLVSLRCALCHSEFPKLIYIQAFRWNSMLLNVHCPRSYATFYVNKQPILVTVFLVLLVVVIDVVAPLWNYALLSPHGIVKCGFSENYT